jgi:hypothetical protein
VTTLNEAQRRAVLEKVLETVDKKFMGPEPDIKRLRQQHESAVLQSTTTEEVEQAITSLLKDLGTSHTGCFHESKPRAAGRIAIAATFTKADTSDGTRWLFQDVHPGGVAAQAGRPTRRRVADDRRPQRNSRPPEATPFALGQTYTFTVRKAAARRLARHADGAWIERETTADRCSRPSR